jgi:shikimate kinase
MNLILKRTPGIYLVGFMGSGKTTVGRLLAERLGWKFADLDDDIEAANGMTIPAIFDTLGEGRFRELEFEALRRRVRSVCCGQATVVSLGGGAFAQPRTAGLLAGSGVSLWLDCPFERLEARVALAANRPLARDPERFRQLFDERRASYSQANYRVPIDNDDPAEAVATILALPVFQR